MGAFRTWWSTPTLRTPSLRLAGFEDEDKNEAPCEFLMDAYRWSPQHFAVRTSFVFLRFYALGRRS
jgi:hypothetical protein